MNSECHISHYFIIFVAQIITILILWQFQRLQIQSIFGFIALLIAYLLVNIIYWWSFTNFFSYLPAWLYPFITFVLSGSIMMIFGNILPGIIIKDFKSSLSIIVTLSGVNAILAGSLSLDLDQQFGKFVLKKLVEKHTKPIRTGIPGFLFLEIDGLSEQSFREALDSGSMPTLKKWIDEGAHKIIQWETDFTSQTGAIQSGILLGNNENIPAYRWWNRELHSSIRAGNFRDAHEIEKRLSNGKGLLINGGTSRTNMFSGDAAESLFTISTVLNRNRDSGPGFYMYLANPFLFGKLIIGFISGVFKEWWQSLHQRLRHDQFTIRSRNFLYGFIRTAESLLMQELTTYLVSNDILRGIPAIYTTYAGYDNICHYAGVKTPEALESLVEIDKFFARIAYITRIAPRPYHIVVLSDHGQSNGGTFKNTYGISLDQLVKNSINKNDRVLEMNEIDEAWDHINVLLKDSIPIDPRTLRVLRTMKQSKSQNKSAKKENTDEYSKEEKNNKIPIPDQSLIVYGSGCVGLIYFTDAKKRMTYEMIQEQYPDLILGLVQHPGVGFALLHSSENGDMVLGKGGIYYLDNDLFAGLNPLANFSPNAAALLRKESSFSNCPDILINTHYDPDKDEICGFENQVSHHGGLGGQQSFPFILYPAILPYNNQPIIGATEVNHLFMNWRKSIQAEEFIEKISFS